MFGTILLSAVTLMHVYVFWRVGSVPFLRRHVSRKFLIGTGVVFWAVFFLGRFFGHSGTGVLARTLELFGMDWMAVMFLATVSLLAIDLVTGFGLLLPRLAPSLRGLALVAGGVLSLVALVQGLRPPVVQEYEVRLSGLPHEMDGTVLVAMSDLHVGTLLGKQWLDARVAQVQAEHPDLVVLLGDIFEGHDEPQKELLQVLHRLSAPLGVWAVLGNHEFHGRDTTGTSLMNIDGAVYGCLSTPGPKCGPALSWQALTTLPPTTVPDWAVTLSQRRSQVALWEQLSSSPIRRGKLKKQRAPEQALCSRDTPTEGRSGPLVTWSSAYTLCSEEGTTLTA